MKTRWFSLLKLNKFSFGEQIVFQLVVFECKYLFSIIFFYFPKSDKKQDRYHTHAFKAISIKLFGQYTEYLLNDCPITGWTFSQKNRTEIFKYIPKNHFHSIGNSTGCMTLLLSGPWGKTWKEMIVKDRLVKYYTWGREPND